MSSHQLGKSRSISWGEGESPAEGLSAAALPSNAEEFTPITEWNPQVPLPGMPLEQPEAELRTVGKAFPAEVSENSERSGVHVQAADAPYEAPNSASQLGASSVNTHVNSALEANETPNADDCEADRKTVNADCKNDKRSESHDNSVQRSSMSMKMHSSFRSAASTTAKGMKLVFMGDDDQVFDKWDNYDDKLEEDFKRSMSVCRNSTCVTGKIFPINSTSFSLQGHPRALSGVPLDEVINEKRAARVLIWHYFQTLFFSLLVAAVCIPIVTALSSITWHVKVPKDSVEVTSSSTADDSSTLGDTNSTDDTETMLIRPNHSILQWMLLVQLTFPLCIYAVLLFVCIRRTFRLPKLLIAVVAVTMGWSLVVCGLFYKYDVAFWFYYGDLFAIVAAYVPCMCVVGWFVEEDPEATTKTRIMDVLFTGALETIVAAATLVYCLFLMPLFFMLTNAWLQMLWLCVVHPLYFEVTTGFIVRKALTRNRHLQRNHIVYQLTIVHSMVHTVALATSLQASIEPVRILAVTLFFYNLSKMIWRSTVIPRDLLVERIFHGWSFSYPKEELADLARMVSVGVITEIILENASIMITPFMMFRMFKEPVFMMIVPNTFFDNNGTYPPKTLVTLIAMLLFFTISFDLVFFFLNYHTNQRLPLINTWRRIKKSQGWYLLFLIYAFACMGVLFLFLTMLILPRAAFCTGGGDDYCSCSTLMYETVCEGGYISTAVDYLIAP